MATDSDVGGERPKAGRPSLTDRTFNPWLGLSLAFFAVAAGAFRLRSTDVFWHLATGRWMVEHGSIPRHDPFRFTSEGLSWVNHEWLFQLLIYGVEQVAGVAGLVVLRQVWVVILAVLLVTAFRRVGASQTASVVLSVVALLGARPRFLMRPELPTFIALVILLRLLRRLHRQRSRGLVPALCVLIVVWANLHGEAILGPALTGLYLLGARLQDRLGPFPGSPAGPSVTWVQVFGIPALLGFCLFVNPYGPHILAVGKGITGAMSGLAAYNPEWVPVWLAPQPFAVFGVVSLAALLIHCRRVVGAWHGPTLFCTLGIGVVAMSAIRHQALFFIVGSMAAAEALAALTRYRSEQGADVARGRTLAAWGCLVAALWCLIPPDSGPLKPRQGRFHFGYGIEPGRFPEAAADFLDHRLDVGPLFNSFAHGGYLLWRLHPPRKVFHEGRMELQPDLLRQIGEARSGDGPWQELLNRYGAVGGLVRIDPRLRPVLERREGGELRIAGHHTANALLFPRETYALVYWDDLVMLFLDRRHDPPADLLAQEYRWVHPEDMRATVERAMATPEAFRATVSELERKLAEDAGNQTARRLLLSLRQARERLRANQPM